MVLEERLRHTTRTQTHLALQLLPKPPYQYTTGIWSGGGEKRSLEAKDEKIRDHRHGEAHSRLELQRKHSFWILLEAAPAKWNAVNCTTPSCVCVSKNEGKSAERERGGLTGSKFAWGIGSGIGKCVCVCVCFSLNVTIRLRNQLSLLLWFSAFASDSVHQRRISKALFATNFTIHFF